MSYPFGFGGKLPPPCTEVLDPDSTITNSTFTVVGGAGSVHATLADASDATYIERATNPWLDECGTPGDTQTVEVSLEDGSCGQYNGSESMFYQVRARKREDVGSGHTMTMEMRLYDGTTLIASRSGITLTTTMANYTDSLSIAEKNAIKNDPSNLRIRILVSACVAAVGDEVQVEIAKAFFEAA